MTAVRGLAGLLLVLAVTGCTTTLRELRLQEPRIAREAAGTPATITECTQNFMEEHYGGLWGRLGGLGYETRQDGPARHLLGRYMVNPADVLFDLMVTPLTATRAALSLRADSPWHPWHTTAIVTAVDACAPPAP